MALGGEYGVVGLLGAFVGGVTTFAVAVVDRSGLTGWTAVVVGVVVWVLVVGLSVGLVVELPGDRDGEL